MIRKIFIVLIVGAIVNSCTRDDICDPSVVATTPLLIIKFKDISNPSEDKQVSNLSVTTIGETPTTILSATTDSIAIPLDVNNNNTQLIFIEDSSAETPNPDQLQFIYDIEDEYVNRACAFRATYENLNVSIENEGIDNWIRSTLVLVNNVKNENETHLIILH